jgi:hypothetical protein
VELAGGRWSQRRPRHVFGSPSKQAEERCWDFAILIHHLEPQASQHCVAFLPGEDEDYLSLQESTGSVRMTRSPIIAEA